ncbi:MAG TPA: cytochrome c3 family protein [Polyangia bacterium]|nr:cytochrome c3 family protein [Polyangia bacterium]
MRALATALGMLACSVARPPAPAAAPTSTPAPAPADPFAVRSNILRADYAGSKACAGCHADLYQGFLASPMHNMTRLPAGASVRAPFDGASFQFKDDSVRFLQAGGERFMQIASQKFGQHVYHVTKIIGGRYREDFAGVEVAAADPGARTLGDPRRELVLPASFVFGSRAFRLKGYSVMVAERPGLRAGGVWNQTCILCHNTNPYLDSMLGALLGPGAPAYQGEVVDALLPPERRFAFEVNDRAGLARALADEIRFLGEKPQSGDERALLAQALQTMRTRFDAAHLLEVGIGCESCHGGSREHTRRFESKPVFEVRAPFLYARPAAQPGHVPTRAELINRTCARCHQVLFSRYPFTWEGGLRSRGPGGSSINSGEARDFLLGGCAGALACTACHDPHSEDKPERMAELQSTRGNAVCTSCHGKYADPAALRAHAHHDPEGAGGVCINCHMPRKNMGLGYTLTRYHRIGSPTERARVEQDRPLECALCHLDRSVGALVSDMERLWGKHYDRAALSALYGDLSASPLLATLSRGKAHEQGTAIGLLGEHKVQAALREVARELTNHYPLVRYFAREALSAIVGQSCPVDLDQDDAQVRAQAARWLDKVSGSTASR